MKVQALQTFHFSNGGDAPALARTGDEIEMPDELVRNFELAGRVRILPAAVPAAASEPPAAPASEAAPAPEPVPHTTPKAVAAAPRAARKAKN